MCLYTVTNSVFVCFMSFTLFKIFEMFVTVSATISQFVGVAFHVLLDVTFIYVFVGTSLLGTFYLRANMVYHMSREFIFLVTSNHCTFEGWFSRVFYFVYFQFTVEREPLVIVGAFYWFFKMGVGVFSE